MRGFLFLLLILICPISNAQINQFPYLQNFDSVTVPNLPPGWTTTTNRSPSGDFKTTSSTIRSAPNAVVDSNATISQSLISPIFNFAGKLVDSLEFYERRTTAYNSGLLVEASTNGGATYSIVVTDTLKNSGNTNYVRRTRVLPSSLDNQPQVRFRWRVLGNGTGTSSSTIRFDDIRTTTKIQFDASVTTLKFLPVYPLVGDSVVISATVKNFGRAIAQNISVKFYDDMNFDSVAQSSELFAEMFLAGEIPPGDSATVAATLHNLPVGEKQIIARCVLLNDENSSNDTKIGKIATGYPPFSIVVNEIMYGPISPEPEWVEFFNATSDSINLKEWKISNRNSTTRYSIASSDYRIAPGKFVLITKDSTALMSQHPSITARVFGNVLIPTGLFRGDSDAVVIFDHRGAVIDSVYYRSSWGGTTGRSLERKFAVVPSNQQSNWGSSQHPARSTPGAKNSITPKDFDVALGAILFDPPAPIVGQSMWIRTIISNRGRSPAHGVLVQFFEDADGDSLPQASELFDSQTIPHLESADSLTLTTQRKALTLGEHFFIVNTYFAGDEDTTNNLRIAFIVAGYLPGAVVIHEIMYGPTSPEPEWVEFLNTFSDSINIKGWKISDKNTALRTTISSNDFSLLPNQFAIAAKDSAALRFSHPDILVRVFHVGTLSTLNNDSDAVVLFDQRGVIMDSVSYHSTWGGTFGRSLERIIASDPSNQRSNWGSSLNSAHSTPGRKNSLTPKDFDLAIGSIKFLPTTPIAGDSVVVVVAIANRGRFTAETSSVQFFEDSNHDSLTQSSELFATQTLLQIAPGDSVIVSAQTSSLVFGDHFFIVQASLDGDEDTTNNVKLAAIFSGYLPGTIIMNELMYAPTDGEPEWLELYNPSVDSVNLKSWKVSNRNSTSKYTITSNDIILLPEQFVVVAKDTALLHSTRPSIPSTAIQSTAMPTFLFNNNGDAAVLFDSRGAVMDSFFYATSWGGANGRSLERIEHLRPSTDSTNWGTSEDSSGATPGRANYLTPLEYDLRAVRLRGAYDATARIMHITFVIMNIGKQPAVDFSVALYNDSNGDSLADDAELILRQSVSSPLLSHDSLLLQISWTEPGYGSTLLIGKIEYASDMRGSNNVVHGPAKVSYPPQSLVINEIMYEPLTGEAEYVELYNKSGLAVDLQDWIIHDMRDATGKANEFALFKTNYVLPPSGYFVLASDSSILPRFGLLPDSTSGIHITIANKSNLSLNNEGDDVVLIDLAGTIVDSVRYAPNWHNAQISETRGRALERIHPDLLSTDRRSWSTSAHSSGGTPAKQNSIFTSAMPSSASLSFAPNPFSPDGDGFEDFTIISYEVPSRVALMRVRIFDARGRLVRTLANGDPTGARGMLVWDGMNDNREKVRMGIYVILLEALDSGGETIHAIKGVVVVAAKL